MAKQGGLGMGLLIGGYDISGDVGAIDNISGPQAPIDVTGINKLAHERVGGKRDGHVGFTSFFNPGLTPAEHVVLSTLPTGDVDVMVETGTILGAAAACLRGRQIGYDPTRGANGELTFKVDVDGDGFGLEWGQLLTAGVRTDVAATNGTAIDTTAAASFGWQAYLQVTAFTGTDVTVKLQDSADNSSFADLASGAFTQITTGTPQAQRIAVGGTATVRRYIRASTVTTGGVTSVSFAVMLVKNAAQTVVF